ncbi:MAG: hypothetical protein FWE18_01800 [Alphaproteobacteria bacterium]|nr:hypothetical protein [Alphaproteobacteria bacterium]
MKYLSVALIITVFFMVNINNSYATEYICSFDTMLTADVNKFSPNYQQILDIKSRSKFVFDITDQSLIVNGEQFVTVFASEGGGLFVYSDRDFPYVMFYFYPNELKLILVGMQESSNDVFLKSDSLSCWNASREVLANLGNQAPIPVAPVIVPTPLTPSASLPALGDAAAAPLESAPAPAPAQETASADSSSNLPANQAIGEIIIPPPE